MLVENDIITEEILDAIKKTKGGKHHDMTENLMISWKSTKITYLLRLRCQKSEENQDRSVVSLQYPQDLQMDISTPRYIQKRKGKECNSCWAKFNFSLRYMP